MRKIFNKIDLIFNKIKLGMMAFVGFICALLLSILFSVFEPSGNGGIYLIVACLAPMAILILYIGVRELILYLCDT